MNTINSVNATDDVAYQRVVRDVDLLRAKNCELQLRLELVQAKLDAVVSEAKLIERYHWDAGDVAKAKAFAAALRSAALGCATTGEGGT